MDIVDFFEIFMYIVIILLFAAGGYILIKWKETHDDDF